MSNQMQTSRWENQRIACSFPSDAPLTREAHAITN